MNCNLIIGTQIFVVEYSMTYNNYKFEIFYGILIYNDINYIQIKGYDMYLFSKNISIITINKNAIGSNIRLFKTFRDVSTFLTHIRHDLLKNLINNWGLINDK